MKKLELTQFLEAKFLGKVETSPSNKQYAFLVSEAKVDKNTYHHSLYLGDEHGRKKLRSLGKNNGYLFLEEDKLLLDLQKNKEEEEHLKKEAKKQFYYLNTETNKLSKAFTLPFRASLEARINDHVVLVSSMMTKDEHILLEGTKEQRETYLKEEKEASLYEDINQIPYYFNGQNFTTEKRKQVFLYDLKEDHIKPLLPKEFSLGTYLVSKDKKTIYYTGKDLEEVMTYTSKIYAYDIEEDKHSVLYDQLDYSIVKLEELEGKLLIAAKDMKTYGLNQNPDFYTLEDGQMTLLRKFGQAIGNTVGSDMRLLGSSQSFVDKDTLYFVSTMDDHCEVFSLNLKGELNSVFTMPGAIDGLFKVNQQVLLIGMKDQKLQELYQVDFEEKSLIMQTRLNSYTLQDTYIAKPKKLVLTKEQHEVTGFVLLPKDYQQDKTYPAILDIHGGPKTVYGSIYYHEMQYWANQGYIVFFANPRGSDGKGDQFADIRGKYGSIDYEDLMDFTDLVLKKYPAIDQENLFVTGGSYGGFMTNWIVGHTNRFKAAVTQRSISNWLSFYGTSDIGYFFASDQTDGHPLKDMDKLYEQSPIKYAMNIHTPLLFIHSDKDHRCPMEQAQQLYAVLKTNKVETKLIWFKEETHELSRSGKPKARIKRLKDITNWFEDHLG
mgnify:CR=1 FL=1